jgi:NAD-dependent dihydropyrimidine dehydrogenase PreA subunit
MMKTQNSVTLERGWKKAQEYCVVRHTLTIVAEFLNNDMCGRCMPCALGIYEMKSRFQNLTNMAGSCDDLDAIRKVAVTVRDSALCVKGKKIAIKVIDSLERSIGHYYEHIDGKCSFFECRPLYFYKIVPDRCNACSECLMTCEHESIVGEKRSRFLIGHKPFEIITERCVRCGACIKVCPAGAIIPSHAMMDSMLKQTDFTEKKQKRMRNVRIG